MRYRTAVVLLALAALLALPATASAITRNSVLARAQTWVDDAVPYSQKAYWGGYRTDCSGYVSMCWKTGFSWSTRSFHEVTHPIAAADLKPGDALLKAGYHIMLFYGWLDPQHTKYVVYEESGPAAGELHDIAADLAFGYVPVRYDRIADSGDPRNLLPNGGFDVWMLSWRGEQLAWWTAGGPGTPAVLTHRRDLAKSSRSSLDLGNPAVDPDSTVSLVQTVAVSPEETYTLSAWALTPADPAAVVLELSCLDASGTVLGSWATAGSDWSLDATSFRQMSVTARPPAGTTAAAVTVRLAGGAMPDTATVGTAVTLDAFSLASVPRETALGLAGRSTAYRYRTYAYAGTLSPAEETATVTVVRQRKVSGRWRTVGTTAVKATGGRFSYRFRPTYRGSWRLLASMPQKTLGFTTWAASAAPARYVTVR